jgi:large subunit ribosomal protein L9
MKVVLRSDIRDLGKKGDVLDVADGYARNFLVPRGLALKASAGAEGQATAMRRSRDVKDAAERTAGEEIARQLVPKVIAISARAGGAGKLFGSVTAHDVVEAVQAQTGIELDRRKVHVDDAIREVGTHRVTVKLHADVEFPVTLEVSAAAAV